MVSNFSFLARYWEELAQIGLNAETYLCSDSNACIYKLGLFAEGIVSEICRFEGVTFPEEARQVDKIRYLSHNGLLPDNICEILTALRKARNDAVHAGLNTQEQAGVLLRMAYNLAVWFMEVYGDWTFVAEPYQEPKDHFSAVDYEEQLRTQEEQIKLLGEQLAEIRTAVSELPREERRKQAQMVSEKLPLSAEEEDYLTAEQLHMEVLALTAINFALQQNHIPVVQSIAIHNPSSRDLDDIDLRISSDLKVFLPYSKHLDLIPANTSFVIKDINVLSDAQTLASLTEKESGLLEISLASDGVLLCEEQLELTVFAFDEWHGYGVYPELLAAFVMPNHPAIMQINGRAAHFLENWTGDPSFDAYQSKDPNRVLAQAAAIYGALQEENIIYSVPPASFERFGQRVRLCDAVLQQKMGTCLDLTLLYAACLEAIGLHPLLILQRGHIFAGVWLEELTFPEAIQDDVSLLTKRLADGINEMSVVECTAFVSGKNMSFDDARRAAGQKLIGIEPIQCIIDVVRTRLSGISPLPIRIKSEAGWQIQREKVDEDKLTAAPQEMGERVVVIEGEGGTPATKKQIWERKLLDLGLRNTLINMRFSRMLPLWTASLDDVEDSLASGSDFAILPRPVDWHIAKESIGFEMMHELGDMQKLVQTEFQNKRLRSVLTEGELARKVKDLYRSSRVALEENGANALYLALGLLRWYETERSTKPRYAPLILLPVELVRKGANRGYVIRLRDDDPQMNITLLEKLSQDFGIGISGLDPLPQDEYGVNVRQVFSVIRKAVMGQKRWDVLESAYLGIFSFSQFVMWNDIRNRSNELAKNKIVRSLMEGRLCWPAQTMMLGNEVPEEGVFLPLSADASQLYAIQAANAGESFVLHGPPGTGKSQTITTLIANSLAQGQTVLFVAEKMAALEVVQKRLSRIGIGPFCLEVHSNKAKKKDVLEQLRQAMEVARNHSSQQYQQKAERITEQRDELAQYVRALHRPQPCGASLFELVNQYEENRDAPEMSPFSDELLEQVSPELLEQQRTMIERLIAAAKEVGHPGAHPLEAIRCQQYSQKLRMELPETVSAYQNALEKLGLAAEEYASAAVRTIPQTAAQLQHMADVAEAVLPWTELPVAWAKEKHLNVYLTETSEMAGHFLNAQRLKMRLSETWGAGFFDLDGQVLLEEYHAVKAKWVLPRLLGMNGLAKRMVVYAKGSVAKERLLEDLSSLAEYQRERKSAEALFQTYGAGLDFLYPGANTNWSAVVEAAEKAKCSAAELKRLTGDDQLRIQFGGKEKLKPIITGYLDAWQAVLAAKARLDQMLELSDAEEDVDWIVWQRDLCQRISVHTDELKEWVAWNRAASEAQVLGLGTVVEAYRKGVPHEQIMPAYQKALSKALAVRYIDMDPVLNTFSGAVFNEKIEQFKRADRELAILTQQEIFCRLAARVPDCTREAAQSSELGILQRAIRSNGRGTSIRKLFEQIPNLLPRLCPCFLMSPMSAAQYLTPDREPFDLVVFDEASQLPTSKAVGALARGKNAVIVGDPKQMPPTSFFAANTVDEDNLDVEDLESILDDCLALNMPQTHLLWHYRSRHESLIAFSNSQFYENKLYTFPSVNDRESKVSMVLVDGVFDRGKTRQNRAEAEAILAELVRRCHDSEMSRYSVGIVTFNISQQNLIEDLLTETCGSDPVLEQWAYESEEPIFIKNLENVQGDERDVILFSVGYGPDQSGKVSMNFGPLNRVGGWRRLNVAVSRARYEMKVYSSMSAEQINLSRSGTEGVAALRAFLEYAKNGKLDADEATIQRARSQGCGVANAICVELRKKGYIAEQAVGRFEYKVDVGVVDPREPGRYLLGILLDGESYGAAKTVRDREISQVDILDGLGWNILRIWAMDWWDNREKEIGRILARLEELKEQPNKPAGPVTMPVTLRHDEVQRVAGNGRQNSVITVRSPKKRIAIPLYEPANLKVEAISAEDFIQPIYAQRIEEKVRRVIMLEAPICESLLIRRVVQSFGIMRAGSRIQNRMTQILSSGGFACIISDDQRVFWRTKQEPELYSGFRASGIENAKRETRDVPVQEASNAICRVLYEQISLLEDDLIREAARLMGYTRSGSIVTELFHKAILCAQRQGRIELSSNGNWILTQEEITSGKSEQV